MFSFPLQTLSNGRGLVLLVPVSSNIGHDIHLLSHVGHQVLTAAKIYVVTWFMTPCSLVDGQWRFGRTPTSVLKVELWLVGGEYADVC
jgi:hypothetical protein